MRKLSIPWGRFAKVPVLFPTELIFAVLSAGLFAWGLGDSGDFSELLLRYAAISTNMFLGSLAIRYALKHWSVPLKQAHAINFIGSTIVALLVCVLMVSESESNFSTHILLLSLVFICALSVTGSIKQRMSNDFWRFNANIIRHAVFAVICGIITAAALAFALFSIEALFGLKFLRKVMASQVSSTFVVMSALVLLSSLSSTSLRDALPKNFEKTLRFLTTYILLPLVSVFLVIIYSYLISIALKREWPKSVLGNIFVCLVLFGGASYVLAWFWRERHRFSRLYVRSFFPLMLIPLLVVVYSLRLRIVDYGWTESRYFLALSMAATAIIGVILVMSKHRKLHVVPVVVGVLALLSLWGPWSALNVSVNSQTRHFEQITRHIKDTSELSRQSFSFEELKRLSSITSYLYHKDKLGDFAKRYHIDMTSCPQYEEVKCFLTSIGVEYVSKDQDEYKKYFNYHSDRNVAMSLGGYKLFCPFTWNWYGSENKNVVCTTKQGNWNITFSEGGLRMELLLPDGRRGLFDLKAFLDKKLVSEIDEETSLPVEDMQISSLPGGVDGKVIFTSIYGTSKPQLEVHTLEAYLFVR